MKDLLPELESSNHAEALSAMLILLKSSEPTTELIRLMLSRETKNRGDPFVTSALRFEYAIVCIELKKLYIFF